MGDIVEAMARAICMTGGWCKYSGGRCNTGRCSISPEVARAALTAALDCMETPSNAMDLAGDNSFQWGGPEGAEWLEAADSTVCWKAMLDQLRKDALDE